MFATKGYSANLKLRGGAKPLLSQVNFFQMIAAGKYVHNVFDIGRFVARGTFGYTAIDKITNLPLSLQLFAGGSQSVRGYRFNSLGPGRYLMSASVEYQQKVYGKWYLIGYFDAGNAFNNFDNPFTKLKTGIGAGIMRQTIIGPVQISIAKPLRLKGIKIVFTMGPDLV